MGLPACQGGAGASWARHPQAAANASTASTKKSRGRMMPLIKEGGGVTPVAADPSVAE
jgi:hypothetical protein